MSPQSRHGRKTRHRHSHGGSTPQPTSTPAAVSPEVAPAAEAPSKPEGSARVRPAPVKKRKQHGLLYRWVAAYLPLLGGLLAVFAGLWVWVTFISPPPAKPVDRWQQIESKWTPAREKARASLAEHGPDFVAQLADYKAFYEATKGWVDEVEAYDLWKDADKDTESAGAVDFYVQRFVADGREYLKYLKKAYEAKTPEEILTMQAELPAADQTWETDRANVRIALGLPAVPEESELPLPSQDCIPAASGSPGATATASVDASGSPAASGSPTVTLPPCPAPTPSASVSASASATATAEPSASPS